MVASDERPGPRARERKRAAARPAATRPARQPRVGRLERLFEMSLELLCIAGTDGYFKRINPAFEQVLGYPLETLLARPFFDFVHPDDVESTKRELRRLADGRPTVNFENRYVRRDGSICWLAWNCMPDAAGELLYATARDVTQQKAAEEVQRVYRRRLRELASELLLVEERERHRLALDLHDGLDQLLALARMKLSDVLAGDRRGGQGGDREDLRAVARLVEEADEAARSLTFQLSPPLLHDLGLEPALQWLVEDMERQHGLQIDLHDDGAPKPTDERIRFVLFRSARELLVNVARHAQAGRVQVSLERDGDLLSLGVEDDGVGFETRQLQDGAHYGLFSIRERLTSLGGGMLVESRPGRGTRIVLMAPLAGADAAGANDDAGAPTDTATRGGAGAALAPEVRP